MSGKIWTVFQSLVFVLSRRFEMTNGENITGGGVTVTTCGAERFLKSPTEI